MTASAELYREPHRPTIHFSPPRYWLNDPNGMFFLDGEYHLFYQHNPHDRVWSTMSWGHAVSHDLFHWEHRGVALQGDGEGGGYCFSGSAVIDRGNTLGVESPEGRDPLALIYTRHSLHEEQTQFVAVSVDGGLSWTDHAQNPVLCEPQHADFRDPKVRWCELTNAWLMVIAAGDHLRFYRSADLLNWHFLSTFGPLDALSDGKWECPDLFPLRDTATGSECWVLLVSVDAGAPNGGSGTAYFTGAFDGERFRAHSAQHRWLDYGPDCYAGVTWHGTDVSAPPLFIAWMNNWRYAARLPTAPWRGSMTLPRELTLHARGAELHVASAPAPHLDSLRADSVPRLAGCGERADLDDSPAWDVELSFMLAAHPEAQPLLRFLHGDTAVTISIDPAGGNLELDRSAAAVGLESCQAFTAPCCMPLRVAPKQAVELRIVYDRGSIEVFGPRGASLTALLFVTHPLTALEVPGELAAFAAASVRAFPLRCAVGDAQVHRQ